MPRAILVDQAIHQVAVCRSSSSSDSSDESSSSDEEMPPPKVIRRGKAKPPSKPNSQVKPNSKANKYQLPLKCKAPKRKVAH